MKINSDLLKKFKNRKVLQKFILFLFFFILLEKDKFIQMKLDFYEIFTIQIKKLLRNVHYL